MPDYLANAHERTAAECNPRKLVEVLQLTLDSPDLECMPHLFFSTSCGNGVSEVEWPIIFITSAKEKIDTH